MNLALHHGVMFGLLERLTQSSKQLQVCAKAVPLLLPKAYGLKGATQAMTGLLGVRAWGWQWLRVKDDHSLGEFTSH